MFCVLIAFSANGVAFRRDKNGIKFHYRSETDYWQGPDYYQSFPQAYLEAGYKNFSAKAGKFLSPLGHSSMMSPDRFFYTLPNAYMMTPSTLTGVVARYDIFDKFLWFDELSVFGGWVSGEDRSFDNSGDNALTGGAKARFGDRVTASYAAVAGKRQPWLWHDKTDSANFYNYYVHSVILNLKFGKRWDYTFEWTHRAMHGASGKAYSMGCYGINQELIFAINKHVALGMRAEWMKFYGNRQLGYKWSGSVNEDQAYSFSIAANLQPTSFLSIRPEVRYDRRKHEKWFNWDSHNSFDDRRNRKHGQLSFGVSCIVKFKEAVVTIALFVPVLTGTAILACHMGVVKSLLG